MFSVWNAAFANSGLGGTRQIFSGVTPAMLLQKHRRPLLLSCFRSFHSEGRVSHGGTLVAQTAHMADCSHSKNVLQKGGIYFV